LTAFETYINKEKDASKINARVYELMGELAAKVAGNESKVAVYYNKAIDLATENKQKMQILTGLAAFHYKAKDYKNAAVSYNKLVQMSENPSTVNLFYATISSYSAGMYQEGANVAKMYAEKYPTDFRGSFWAARNNAQIDSTGDLGLAIPDYEKFIPIAETEPEKNKKNLMEAYKYLFAFYSKSDKVKAQSYVDKIKAADPADADLPNFEAILSGKVNKPTVPPPAPRPVPTPPAKPGVTPAKPTNPPVKTGTTPGKQPTAKNNTKTPVKTSTKAVSAATTVKKS
jgi:tetratricopeptide (TPR) repeat protein